MKLSSLGVCAFALVAWAGLGGSQAMPMQPAGAESGIVLVKGGHGHGHGHMRGNRGLHRGWYVGRHRGWRHRGVRGEYRPVHGAYGYYRGEPHNGAGWSQTGYSASFGNNSGGTRSPGVPGDLGNR